MLNLNKERQEWKQEGVQLGMKQGVQRGQRKTARRLLALGLLTDQQIAEASDLTIEQIRAMKTKNRH